MGKGSDQSCEKGGLGTLLDIEIGLKHPLPRYQEKIQPVQAVDAAAWEYLTAAWAGRLEKLSPAAQTALLQAVPETHNVVYGKKPELDGRCAEYCSRLAHLLDQHGVEVCMVGGLYFDEIEPGTTLLHLEELVAAGEETDEIFDWGSHTWLEVEGQLIDPTAGQFFKNGETEWQYHFYLPTQLKIDSFLQGWGKSGLHLGGSCIYGSNGLRKKF